jgi:alpha-tubulin suppressor-like RCC1 family protein
MFPEGLGPFLRAGSWCVATALVGCSEPGLIIHVHRDDLSAAVELLACPGCTPVQVFALAPDAKIRTVGVVVHSSPQLLTLQWRAAERCEAFLVQFSGGQNAFDVTVSSEGAVEVSNCPANVCGAVDACSGPREDGGTDAGFDAGTGAESDAGIDGGAKQEPTLAVFSAGFYVTCALGSDAGAWCWGTDGAGVLGNPDRTSSQSRARPTPMRVTDLPGSPISIHTGGNNSCAVLDGGRVACWGDDQFGVLGLGFTAGRANEKPLLLEGLDAGGLEVTVGYGHACVLTSQFGVQCWGLNDQGQLGNGSSLARSLLPVDVTGLSRDVQSVSCGTNHCCALQSTGKVVCWGSNNALQLGVPLDAGLSRVPIEVLAGPVRQISAGGSFNCAVLGDGGVQCWGVDRFGQLGDQGANAGSSKSPIAVEGLGAPVSTVSAGGMMACAALVNGDVFCWGYDRELELGGSGTSTQAPPRKLTQFKGNVRTISCGERHSCALTTDAGLWCWGDNSEGELGNGTDAGKSLPGPVVWPPN